MCVSPVHGVGKPRRECLSRLLVELDPVTALCVRNVLAGEVSCCSKSNIVCERIVTTVRNVKWLRTTEPSCDPGFKLP